VDIYSTDNHKFLENFQVGRETFYSLFTLGVLCFFLKPANCSLELILQYLICPKKRNETNNVVKNEAPRANARGIFSSFFGGAKSAEAKTD